MGSESEAGKGPKDADFRASGVGCRIIVMILEEEKRKRLWAYLGFGVEEEGEHDEHEEEEDENAGGDDHGDRLGSRPWELCVGTRSLPKKNRER